MEQFNSWKQSRTGQAVMALAEAGLAYGFASLAIDRGNLVFYALALFSAGALVVTLVNLFKPHHK
jgi:hypothetical protein